VAAIVLFSATRVLAATGESVLVTFNGNNGMVLLAGLISDKAANLYGTTSVGGTGSCDDFGGAFGCGTVFELTPSANGNVWTETILYSFQGGSDGIGPAAALVFDQAGNLYGTTEVGGTTFNTYCINGCGTVFELKPPTKPGAAWTETVLHSFELSDGATPSANLVVDPQGNLYGTTLYGGSGPCPYGSFIIGCGTVFQLEPPSSKGAAWTENVLHSFTGGGVNNQGSDGGNPSGGLILHESALYGTTPGGGGPFNAGTVFELKKLANGTWKEVVLYSFTGGSGGTDGASPSGNLVFDKNGVLYGTTSGAGASIGGTVFQLAPPNKGTRWTETVLYNFTLGSDGGVPYAGVIFDSAGNLYGTTAVGGDYSCNAGFNDGCGVVFKLAPPASQGGVWTETVLHSFSGGMDGVQPECQLTFGESGLLYGTTESGGTSDDGTVFRALP
jgi:hypothetical protein